MRFSFREQKMLDYLLQYHQGVSVGDFERMLGVSRRTVYRELKSLEETLDGENVRLVNERGRGYYLEFTHEEAREELKRQLLNQEDEYFDARTRQDILSLALLSKQIGYSYDELADYFQVSPSTIQTDFFAIERSLRNYQIKLIRGDKGQLTSHGSQIQTRQLIANLIYANVSEYDFYRYLSEMGESIEQENDDYFINIVDDKYWSLASTILFDRTGQLLTRVSDKQMQRMVTSLAVSLQAIDKGDDLRDSVLVSDLSSRHLQLAHQVMGLVSEALQQPINISERHFLARQLAGLNFQESETFPGETYDAVMIYRVKELIRLTSESMGNDFRFDQTLYQDLLTHISAAIHRIQPVNESLESPILEDIRLRYRHLFDTVKHHYEQIFYDYPVSKDELIYIVLHFASSLERQPLSLITISVLVICSSGIGTAKILESRLRKHIPEIQKLDIARLSQLKRLNYDAYDLVLSTIYLEDFEPDYLVISPLLMESEVQQIRQRLDSTIQNKQKSHYLDASTSLNRSSHIDFSDLLHLVLAGQDLLDGFEWVEWKGLPELDETIKAIVNQLPSQLITDNQKVGQSLIDRYQLAPIGIPGSRIALFHSRQKEVKQAIFQVYQLDQSYSIMGMDHHPIQLDRLLLMLAPSEMSGSTSRLLGAISRSLIENDLNIATYERGDSQSIRHLLERIFIKEIQEIE
ncbi:BglG family transcription antiterminator [Hutsoniella sourekii]